MANEGLFSIEILEQGWLGDSPEASAVDLCSHGKLRISMAGTTIASGTEDFGISETALALLRTLEKDHTPSNPVAETFPGAPRLVFHGCGLILMMGCPLGIDWKVEHLPGDKVRISDIHRFETSDENKFIGFPNLSVEVGEREYQTIVTCFARKAKELFIGVHKTIKEGFDRQQYEEFWQEFESLLAKYG